MRLGSITASLLLASQIALTSLAAELLPPERPPREAIDYYIDAGLAREKVDPAPRASDANLVRRLTLDLAGRIPTVAETKAFIQSGDANKVERLVDRLMASPGFVRYQAYELDAMLMSGYRGSVRNYLLEAVEENRPWSQMFRELLVDKVSDTSKTATTEFVKQRADDPDKLANDVSVLFFGVNISCAKCHDHPLVSDWKQDHFYGMRSFFSRTFENGGFVAERDYGVDQFRTTSGEEKTARLMFLTGAVIDEPQSQEPSDAEKKEEKKRLEELKKQKQPPPAPKFSRRAQLVEVALKSGENDYFAKAIVNRLFDRLLGQGLVMPLDQMHSSNPPSHPELLDWLARDLAAHDYDLRRLMRELVLTRAYARSSLWEQSDRPRADLFAVANVRALTPQQYAASLKLASTDPASLASDAAALEKQLESIDNAARGIAGELDMPTPDFQVSVNEALLLSNSEKVLKEYFDGGNARLVTALEKIEDDRTLVETVVWSVLSRPADEQEIELLSEYLAARRDRRQDACQQILWALLTSAEFRFNY
jgi:hypothetical protein